jgi:trk system potassium uptake protein TrkH
MRHQPVKRILGVLLMVFSLFMLPPLAVSWYYGIKQSEDPITPALLLIGDGGANAFILSFAIILALGLAIWFPARGKRHGSDLKIRDGFLVVSAFWLGLGMAGAVPLFISTEPALTITDAVFESISGLTTTGATVLTGLDELPRSILFYRQQLQWLGGMGIIVLAVAVLPMLGIGGMQLYRAETPGPVKDTKLTPRIKETAKALWFIYGGITLACFVAYLIAGMSTFDAISHSFSTVAIGGFSTHDTSIGYFDNRAIELVAMCFMIIAGVNFSLHFVAWRRLIPRLPWAIEDWRLVRQRSTRRFQPIEAFRGYFLDPEFRAYLAIIGVLSVIVVASLHSDGTFSNWRDSVRYGLFQVVSIATTTGYSTANFHLWMGALPIMLLFASFIGGCAGSTGGGMKVIRWLLLYKQGRRELTRLLHPSALVLVKLGSRPVPQRVVEAVWGFFAAYAVVFVVMMVILMWTGLDQVTAFSAVAASLNNLGPGLGAVAENYSGINDLSKWVCVLAMVMGRLEIFTLLILITPEFWR